MSREDQDCKGLGFEILAGIPLSSCDSVVLLPRLEPSPLRDFVGLFGSVIVTAEDRGVPLASAAAVRAW